MKERSVYIQSCGNEGREPSPSVITCSKACKWETNDRTDNDDDLMFSVYQQQVTLLARSVSMGLVLLLPPLTYPLSSWKLRLIFFGETVSKWSLPWKDRTFSRAFAYCSFPIDIWREHVAPTRDSTIWQHRIIHFHVSYSWLIYPWISSEWSRMSLEWGEIGPTRMGELSRVIEQVSIDRSEKERKKSSEWTRKPKTVIHSGDSTTLYTQTWFLFREQRSNERYHSTIFVLCSMQRFFPLVDHRPIGTRLVTSFYILIGVHSFIFVQ